MSEKDEKEKEKEKFEKFKIYSKEILEDMLSMINFHRNKHKEKYDNKFIFKLISNGLAGCLVAVIQHYIEAGNEMAALESFCNCSKKSLAAILEHLKEKHK